MPQFKLLICTCKAQGQVGEILIYKQLYAAASQRKNAPNVLFVLVKLCGTFVSLQLEAALHFCTKHPANTPFYFV